MPKSILLLLLLLVPSFCLWAQPAATDIDSLVVADQTVRFRSTQLILPLSLVAVGAVGVMTPGLKSFNRTVRNGVADLRKEHYVDADNYIQYLPVVSTFGLSLLGAKAKHSYVERVLITATAYAAMGVMVNGVKFLVNEQRPDGTAFNSFPSGHTATAFMGAELVRMEYKDDSPLYGIGAYTIACGVAFLRVYNERHWCNDVLAGAGIGILSARIGYWLLPFERKLLGLDKRKSSISIATLPFYDSSLKGYGGTVAILF